MEKITIIAPIEEAEEAIQYCSNNGYRFLWSGPKPIGKWKKDFTKIRIVAEREVKEWK